jgi:hypothetical protein
MPFTENKLHFELNPGGRRTNGENPTVFEIHPLEARDFAVRNQLPGR